MDGQEHLPEDIVKMAIDQHAEVIRLSYVEIASGITRLLRQGIPKEVICQVLNQAVEALADRNHADRGNSQL
jgi:UDP-N-acetylglucosamine 2-epimerase